MYWDFKKTLSDTADIIKDILAFSNSSYDGVTFYTDTSVGVNVGVKNDVNETQKQILLLMAETPTISAQRIADAIGITKRRVESNIRSMKKAGLIERAGSDKNGHWVVIR